MPVSCPVFPVAFVVGVLAALLFTWSGAIWPGVILRGFNNATALVVPLAISSRVQSVPFGWVSLRE